MILGLKIDASPWHPRSVIGEIETSSSGNIILSIGREVGADGWEKTEHVVLTREEADELRVALRVALNIQPGKTRVI